MFTAIELRILSIVAAIILVFSSGWCVNGWRYEKKIAVAKVEQQKAIQAKELANQIAVDQLRKEKNAQINSINNQLVNSINELRTRPSRSASTSNGQNGTGATLYAEDAEFLIREAARADQIRTGLESCYKQYDAVTK